MEGSKIKKKIETWKWMYVPPLLQTSSSIPVHFFVGILKVIQPKEGREGYFRDRSTDLKGGGSLEPEEGRVINGYRVFHFLPPSHPTPLSPGSCYILARNSRTLDIEMQLWWKGGGKCIVSSRRARVTRIGRPNRGREFDFVNSSPRPYIHSVLQRRRGVS